MIPPQIPPLFQASFGPGSAASGPSSYTVPESLGIVEFVCLSVSVTTAAASTPDLVFTTLNKQGQVRYRATTDVTLTAASVNQVSFGDAAASTGTFTITLQTPHPSLTLEGGDVFTLSLSGGGGADTIGVALVTLLVLAASLG